MPFFFLQNERHQKNRQALHNQPLETVHVAQDKYCFNWAKKGDGGKGNQCLYKGTHTAEMRGRDAPKGKGRGKSKSRSPSQGKGKDKGTGKGKSKGKGRSRSPPHDRSMNSQICRDYMQGKCSTPCPNGRVHPGDCAYFANGHCTRGGRLQIQTS